MLNRISAYMHPPCRGEWKVRSVRADVTMELYRNDERNGVDHLQKKGHLEDLLPDVPLK